MKKYFIKISQGDQEILSSPVSEANVGDLPLKFLRFTATEDGVVIESTNGTTFHLAGGDVTSGLLTHGESVQIDTYTIICEEENQSEAAEEFIPQSEAPDWNPDQDMEQNSPLLTEEANSSIEITGLKFAEDEVTNAKEEPLIPMLVLLTGNAQKKSFNLVDKDQYIIGRSEDADIVIDDNNASRHHAELFFENDQFYLRDLESANGTSVNGQSISLHELSSLDIIEIGGTSLKFILVNEAIYEEPSNTNLSLQLFNPDYGIPGITQAPNIPQNLWSTPRMKPKISPRKIILFLLVAVLGYGLAQKYLLKDNSAVIKTPDRVPAGNISLEQRNQIDAIFQRAVDFYSNRQYEEAISEANKVLEVLPNDEKSLQLIQNAQYAIKSVTAAKELQRTQVEGELVEDQVKFYLGLGIEYLQKEDYPKAEEAFLKVLEIDPGNSEAERRLKLAQSNLQPDEDRGLASVDESPEDTTAKAESLMAEGQSLLNKQDYKGAIQAWNGVLQLEGEEMLKFYAKAERSIGEAENLLEKKNAPLIDQARHNLQTGNFEEAKSYAKQLLEQDPSHAEAQEILGEVSFRLNQQAKTLFTKAVIDESLGDLDKAKLGFLKIIQTVDEGDEYFDKAKDHLKKYPKD